MWPYRFFWDFYQPPGCVFAGKHAPVWTAGEGTTLMNTGRVVYFRAQYA
ncbi:hypothetical protein HMPREF0578_1270 [Mobiluncus mulieris 28-1]|uniref:Uncharacterized protein n=1 Tax=Mobiluncus mulieris ATCC 35239 TaxID=871571 RepID=E0QPW3_9ACTO|nr:hypothetical protein HMPREF0577_0247 [Mobiluncus mulieris ATCC 35243]EEZ91544.1 hypothetical protein HMPREF0578_1270 [Mobiluncus mulieris 28-1]EFM46343.1 hypothetical protein HMPREF0580_0890 [Mobiluncus mulieris ATCC 35239]